MVWTFNAWSPYRHDDDLIEFDLTQAEAWLIARGTEKLIGAALSALNISVAAFHWEIVSCRAFYYTSYPNPRESWRDRWPETWTVRVVPTAPLAAPPNNLRDGMEHVEELDATWDGEYDDDRFRHAALVIADFRKTHEEVTAIAAELGQLDARLHPEPVRRFGERLNQLRLFARDISLPEDLPLLERCLEHCRAADGLVHWQERIKWREEPPAPTISDIERMMREMGLGDKPR